MAALLVSTIWATTGTVPVQAEEPKALEMSQLVKRVLVEYQKEDVGGLYFSIYSMSERIEKLPDQQITFTLVDPQSGKETPVTTGSFHSNWQKLNTTFVQVIDRDMVLDDRPQGLRLAQLQLNQYRLLAAYAKQDQQQLTEEQKSILNGSQALFLLMELRQAYAAFTDMKFSLETLKREGRSIRHQDQLNADFASQRLERQFLE